MANRHRPTRSWLAVLTALVGLMVAAPAVSGASSGADSGYRPARIHPVFGQPSPGEGVWTPVGKPIGGASPMLVTTFRADAHDPSIIAYVAWIDHTRAELGLYPGLDQPPSATPRGPAEVPSSQRWRLLATFNGGFKFSSRGGDNGFAVDGHTYVPMKRGLGTLVGYRNGLVDVVDWRGRTAPPAYVVFARQNLPLIVDNGRGVPGLDNTYAWGATLGNATAVWRTAVGIDRHGNLIYAAAGSRTAAGLAGIMIRAGAVRAMELDINPEWPTLIIYSHRHGLHSRMFVPNYQQTATRYLTPDRRDFFAVYRRVDGVSASVPFN